MRRRTSSCATSPDRPCARSSSSAVRSPGQALGRFARGLAQALVVVHRADVLHRDVKPSNVLIEEGDPVLIDFGLAQLSDDLTLTQPGWLLGTPGYLAPEILYGDGPTPQPPMSMP